MGGSDGLAAAIFDVDGTLVDSERDGHRVAFNRAFEEFGLPDRWEPERYGELLIITGGDRRLDAHLAERGMPAAERELLVPHLHRRKTELFEEIIARGELRPRPGVEPLLGELDAAGVPLAVATTGTRSWVVALLDRLFGAHRFRVVITADEASVRKPDPSAYLVAMDRLGLGPAGVVAVEDSRNGLVAATAAGLRCLVVVNGYTRDQDLGEADLVVGGFGGAEPARALHDPRSLRPGARVDLRILRELACG